MNAISLLQAHITGGSKPVLGDFLVITGTIFFALSNVGEVST
jgi:solute carrier family 35 protein F1/2